MNAASSTAGLCPYGYGARTEVEDFSFTRSHPLNPPDQVARLRKSPGLSKVRLWDGSHTWIATHYEDVRSVLADPRFSTVTSRPGYPFVSSQRREVLLNGLPNFTFMDAPEHTKFRRALARLFTVNRFEAMRPAIEATVETLLDEIAETAQPVDLYQDFALRMPIRVLIKLTGVPQDCEELFIEAAEKRVNLAGNPADSHESGRVLWDYLDAFIASREADPGTGEDITSLLVRDQILPGKLTRHDAVLMINQLLIAGYDNTANAIAMGMIGLLENPDQFALLAAEPERALATANEVLRYATNPQFHASRAAVEDVMVGETLVRAGEGVLALLHGANRDPAEFQEPDRFDITRDAAHHMSFSFGMHQCLGQSLARLELMVVFTAFAQRFPTMQLARPLGDITFNDMGLAYGPLVLPVRW